MKTPRILALTIASLLLTPFTTRAVTDTWDGGSLFSNNLDADHNWVDGSAPLSSLASTDLIFGGSLRLTPFVSAEFSTRSITFNNTAGQFVIGGLELHVGAGGIVNNDAQTMTFTNPVDFSATGNVTINAAVGGLTFTEIVKLPSATLTVAGGGSSSFQEIGGDGTGELTTLVKTGSGVMTWRPNNSVTHFDVSLDAGTLTLPAGDGLVSFSNSSAIAVNGTSTFNINEYTSIGGALTRAAGAAIHIAAGKILELNNGTANITGAFLNDTASTISLVNGTFTTTSTLTLGGGSTTSVSFGSNVLAAGAINVGTSGDATVTVTDGTSSFGGGNLAVGLAGNAGSVTYSNGSTGTFGGIDVDASSVAGTSGALSIQSGAAVTGTSLDIATNTFANSGSVLVTGLGSMLSLNGATTANIGAASVSTGALSVSSSGTFNSGTGLTIVHPTGAITLNGGTYNSHGNLRIDGGYITRNAAGVLTLDAGTALTVQNGGIVSITNAFANATASAITVTGAGSTFTTTGNLSVNGGSTLGVLLGGDVSAGAGAVRIGTGGDGTVTVDGAGSSLNGAALVLGLNGDAGSLTFTNASTGTLGAISVDASGSARTSGLLQIQSGAVITGTSLVMADEVSGNTGTVTITGAGSALTFVGASAATIGAASASSGVLNVNSSGTFNSGTGLTTVNATGTIAIGGGTYNANGSLTLNGGQLTRNAAGVFALDAGRTFRVQAGGDAAFTGGLANSTASAIVVTGAGSTLTTTGGLDIQGGSTLNVATGGSVSTGAGNVSIGAFAGDGAATVIGAGSSLSGNSLNLALNGNTGGLTFTNGSTGNFGVIGVAASSTAGTFGTLSIQSGATVTGTRLLLGSNAAATTGSVLITGAGSALTLNGGLSSTIGAASGSAATLTVANGGTFTTGTGLTTVNATGELNINSGGTMIVRGDMVVNSALNIGDGGTVILGEGAPFAPAAIEFAETEVGMSGNLDFGSWENSAFASADASVGAVPEPGIGALLASGLALLGMRPRRRRSCDVPAAGCSGGVPAASPVHSRASLSIASAVRISLAFFLSATAFAQGPLIPPPGVPAPTMKTLQQIEPRIDLQSNPSAAGVNTGDASYEFIINQPGSYYLSANLGVSKPNGIQINAEGVTLHLSGFEISRTSGAGGHAIEIVPTAHRTRIGHGAIKGFAYGVRSLEGVTGGFAGASGFDDLTVSGCTVVGIFAGEGATLEACRVRESGAGITTSSGSALSNCTATRNTGPGMTIDSGSSAVNCVAFSNGGSGIALSGSSSVLRGCVANANRGPYGIFASQNANLTDCTASSNNSSAATSAGISAGIGSVLSHCTASNNNSTAALTPTTGMGFTLGSGSMIRGCVAAGNKGNGIRITENSTVRDNQCDGNGSDVGTVGTGAGVHATGGDNRIEGNNVTDNDRGIDVDAAGNLIIKNSASGNTGAGPAPAPNYSVVGGNFLGTVVTTEAAMNASTNSNSNLSF